MNYLALLLVAVILNGCASDAGGPPASRAQFHDVALMEQNGPLALPFDSYIVGIEKDNASRAGRIAECAGVTPGGDCLAIDAPYFRDRPDLRRALRGKYAGWWQRRPTYVSHIARFGPAGRVCYLYNLYRADHPCDAAQPVAAATAKPVTSSWGALATLGRDIERYVAERKPSHVIVYTMGWNTYQPEAMANIRDLGNHLIAAAGGDAAFRPLIVGVTWPSTGAPKLTATDFGIKAKDADEVGAIWENILLNRELRRIKPAGGFKLVVIGHSFGARLATRATFSAPLVTAAPTPVVDLLVSLQGAYSYNRYVTADDGAGEGIEGAPYRDFASQVGQVVLTSSREDEAVTKVLHGPFFVGSHDAYTQAGAGPYAARFVRTATDPGGQVPALACDPRRVLWLDASSIVKGNQPGTGGGAHSMIYTPEMGRLVYQLIRTCTMAGSAGGPSIRTTSAAGS